MITVELEELELQRLIYALTIACDTYVAKGMDIQSISFELLRDRLEALLDPDSEDSYDDFL